MSLNLTECNISNIIRQWFGSGSPNNRIIGVSDGGHIHAGVEIIISINLNLQIMYIIVEMFHSNLRVNATALTYNQRHSSIRRKDHYAMRLIRNFMLNHIIKHFIGIRLRTRAAKL